MQEFNYNGDYNYAYSRLEGTYVMHNGKIRWVNNINTVTGKCLLTHPITGKRYESHVDELVVNEYNLGYVNYTNRVGYITRIPSKQYKQGLREETLFDKINKHHITGGERAEINMFCNFYPNISSCIEMVDCEGVEHRAFHKHFAIGSKELGGAHSLFYKHKPVGVLYMSDMGQANAELVDKHKWLEETVGEVL